jgi:hypothetical protein
VLVETLRKVREKDDADYDEINAAINKLSKPTYTKLTDLIKSKIAARDPMFRLRVTTLLFDRGIRQNFYASLLADLYSDIVKAEEDARSDQELGCKAGHRSDRKTHGWHQRRTIDSSNANRRTVPTGAFGSRWNHQGAWRFV